MPFIPVADTVSYELIFTYDGQVCENVFNYDYGTAPGSVEMTDMAAWLVIWWNTNVKPNVPTTVSLTKVKATDLSSQTGRVVEYSTGLPSAGASAQPALPNNCTLVVKWLTAMRGRSYRGRTYHIGLDEYNTVSNNVTGAYAQLIKNAYQLLLLPNTTPQPSLVVVSRYANKQPRANGVTTPITHCVVDSVIDSQRRRLPGRGS